EGRQERQAGRLAAEEQVDAIEVGAQRLQPRPDGVADAVPAVDDDDAARFADAAVGPGAAARQGVDDMRHLVTEKGEEGMDRPTKQYPAGPRGDRVRVGPSAPGRRKGGGLAQA